MIYNDNLVRNVDGSVVDVGTKEGANSLLLRDSKPYFISITGQEIRNIRSQQSMDVYDIAILSRHQQIIFCLAQYADENIFREKVPPSTIQNWLNYVIVELKRLSTNQDWINNGVLHDIDKTTFAQCVSMFRHVVPVFFAFESDFFQSLAGFIKARQGKNGRGLPSCNPSLSAMAGLVYHAYHTTTVDFDKTWSEKKFFKKLEATGMLEQYLRCSTAPQSNASLEVGRDFLLSALQSCTVILSKKFKRGEACGDTLRAILHGRDGSEDIAPQTYDRLVEIARLVVAMETPECGHCGGKSSSQKSLKLCTQCCMTHYCSRACQKADWKQHKQMCKLAANSGHLSQDMLHPAMQRFADHFCAQLG